MQDEKIISLSSGFNHYSGLTNKGRIYLFGSNIHGQLGNGRINPYIWEKSANWIINEQILGNYLSYKEEFTKVLSTGNHNIALTSYGRVFGWGNNIYSQTGHSLRANGESLPILTPTLFNAYGFFDQFPIINISTSWGLTSFINSEREVYLQGRQPDSINYFHFNVYENIFELPVDEYLETIYGYNPIFGITNKGNVYSKQFYSSSTSEKTSILTAFELEDDNPQVLLNNVLFNSNINLPIVELQGYSFMGWFMDSKLSIPFSLTKMPESDILIYAKFI
jgi:alpha-tubulin suppressor-like RCC1 family protein